MIEIENIEPGDVISIKEPLCNWSEIKVLEVHVYGEFFANATVIYQEWRYEYEGWNSMPEPRSILITRNQTNLILTKKAAVKEYN